MSVRLALASTLIVLLGACGGGRSGDASTSVPPAVPGPSPTVPAGTRLSIEVGTAHQPNRFSASLECGAAAAADGFLADRAPEACEFLARSTQAAELLLEGPPPGRICTEIYGGGEVARISGSLDGAAVSSSFDRSDGCGIADWELLQPILVEPFDPVGAACSADGFSIPDGDQPELPPAVAETRTQLVVAAASCDFDGLGGLAQSDGTSFSFGGDTDPAVFWRELERVGGTPMRDMLTVLHMAPGMLDVTDEVYHVWPAVAALDDWSRATEAQRRELELRFGSEALADWDLFGAYAGYRVGIAEGGRWAFFVAGD